MAEKHRRPRQTMCPMPSFCTGRYIYQTNYLMLSCPIVEPRPAWQLPFLNTTLLSNLQVAKTHFIARIAVEITAKITPKKRIKKIPPSAIKSGIAHTP